MRLIRPMIEGDEALIYATWLRSQRHGNSWYNAIEQDAYYDNYKRVVEARLNNSTVLVSCLESDPDVVVGYVVYSGDTLHWVYVKKAWRKLGIASEMLNNATITTTTSLTRIGKLLKPDNWTFNPFI